MVMNCSGSDTLYPFTTGPIAEQPADIASGGLYLTTVN